MMAQDAAIVKGVGDSCPRCLGGTLVAIGLFHQWADPLICSQLCGYTGDGSLAVAGNAPYVDWHGSRHGGRVVNSSQTGGNNAKLFTARIFEHTRHWTIGQGDGVRTIEFEFCAKPAIQRPNNPHSTTKWIVEGLFGLEALDHTAVGGARNKQVSGTHMREAITYAISVVLGCHPDLIRGVRISIQRYVGPASRPSLWQGKTRGMEARN